ncbi:hypothetical protein Tco_0430850 [Tanacetum coccineum]
MTTTAAQQVALDNALVPLENRVEIGKCNMRIDPIKTQKEPTYQVVLDALALTTCYPAFLITADECSKKSFTICPRLPIMSLSTSLDEEVISSLLRKLGHKGDIKSITEVVVDHMMTNQQMRDSTAYKTYLAYATGAASPKMKRKFKKPASPSKKKSLVAVDEPADKPVKKPAAKRQSAGVRIQDTPGVSVSKKKAPLRLKEAKELNCYLMPHYLRKRN